MSTNLRETLKLKREDWCETIEKQIIQLEDKVKTKDSEIHRLNDIINSLKKDFKYNIGLIKQRDTELAKYEGQVSSLKELLTQKEQICSKLSVKLEEYRSELSTANSIKEQLREELKQSFSMRYSEKEEMQRQFKFELDKARSEHQTIQSNLKMELSRLQSDFSEQKEALFSDIHKTLLDKDNEATEKTSELNKVISATELKCQLLEKELSAIKEKRASDEKTISNLESAVSSLKQESDLSQAEMKSDIAVLEFEKNRLNDIIARQNQAQQKLLDESTEKHRQFDLKLKEKNSTIEKLKETHQNECDNYLSKLQGLTTSLHIAQNELTEKNKVFAELEKSIKEENASLKLEHDKLSNRILKLNSDLVEKDNSYKEKIVRLQEQNEKLLEGLKTREESIERLHEELSAALTINDERIQQQFQQEFEMHQKSDLLEANRLNHFENLVQRIIQSRDEMQVKNMRLIETLHEKEKTIASLSHNFPTENSKQFEYQLKTANQKLISRIKDLEKQNESLKDAIREMSKDVLQAAERFSDDGKGRKSDTDIMELTMNLNKVQKERLELLALCRKQQVKITDLEEKIYQYENAIKDRETTIANLQQELTVNHSKDIESNQSLRKRIAELESHIKTLNEHYSSRHPNRLNESLQIQGETSRNNQVNDPFISHSHRDANAYMYAPDSSHKVTSQYCPACSNHPPKSQSIDPQTFKEICEKLRQASNQIQKLATEKQVLIDLSNRLRAELREASKGRTADNHPAYQPPQLSRQNPHSQKNSQNDNKLQANSTFPERLETTAKHLNKAMVDMQKKIEHLEKIHTDLLRNSNNPPEPNNYKATHESDSVNTSQAIDRLDDIFNLLDEPASLTTSTSFNPRIDNVKDFDIGSAGDHGFHMVPPLQVRGNSATFGLKY